MEQSKPRGNLPGDFEAPQDVKDFIQFVIFDFVSSGPGANIETGCHHSLYGDVQASRPAGIVGGDFVRTGVALF